MLPQNGLYLATRPKRTGIGTHYSIIDVGNIIRHPKADGIHPVVIHRTDKGLRFDYLSRGENYKLINRIQDIEGAKKRLYEASKSPEYDLFGNNCEHLLDMLQMAISNQHRLMY